MANPTTLPMPPGIFAVILLRRSRTYFEGFLRLTENATTDPSHSLSHPAYFLYNHAIELALKAYLAASGQKEKDLAKLGHNLVSLLDACGRQGLSQIPDLRAVVRTLAENNQDHDFRYPTPFNLHVPMPWYCAQIFRQIEPAVEPKVLEAQADAEAEIQLYAERNNIKSIRFTSEVSGKFKRNNPPTDEDESKHRT